MQTLSRQTRGCAWHSWRRFGSEWNNNSGLKFSEWETWVRLSAQPKASTVIILKATFCENVNKKKFSTKIFFKTFCTSTNLWFCTLEEKIFQWKYVWKRKSLKKWFARDVYLTLMKWHNWSNWKRIAIKKGTWGKKKYSSRSKHTFDFLNEENICHLRLKKVTIYFIYLLTFTQM